MSTGRIRITTRDIKAVQEALKKSSTSSSSRSFSSPQEPGKSDHRPRVAPKPGNPASQATKSFQKERQYRTASLNVPPGQSGPDDITRPRINPEHMLSTEEAVRLLDSRERSLPDRQEAPQSSTNPFLDPLPNPSQNPFYEANNPFLPNQEPFIDYQESAPSTSSPSSGEITNVGMNELAKALIEELKKHKIELKEKKESPLAKTKEKLLRALKGKESPSPQSGENPFLQHAKENSEDIRVDPSLFTDENFQNTDDILQAEASGWDFSLPPHDRDIPLPEEKDQWIDDGASVSSFESVDTSKTSIAEKKLSLQERKTRLREEIRQIDMALHHNSVLLRQFEENTLREEAETNLSLLIEQKERETSLKEELKTTKDLMKQAESQIKNNLLDRVKVKAKKLKINLQIFAEHMKIVKDITSGKYSLHDWNKSFKKDLKISDRGVDPKRTKYVQHLQRERGGINLLGREIAIDLRKAKIGELNHENENTKEEMQELNQASKILRAEKKEINKEVRALQAELKAHLSEYKESKRSHQEGAKSQILSKMRKLSENASLLKDVALRKYSFQEWKAWKERHSDTTDTASTSSTRVIFGQAVPWQEDDEETPPSSRPESPRT